MAPLRASKDVLKIQSGAAGSDFGEFILLTNQRTTALTGLKFCMMIGLLTLKNFIYDQ